MLQGINRKKIVFLTGTRADFGKLKSLLLILTEDESFELHIYVTGMHMLTKYGYTCDEIKKCGFKNIYMNINQNHNDTMDNVLAKTIAGFSDYVKEIEPDLIVVHGDRVETLAGAIVGSLNNILVAHIEGGEVSGTVDELIRHAVTKISRLHFVANTRAKVRLIQLGESEESIFIIGSPDIDIMMSPDLPSIGWVKDHYEINFENYGIVLFHPVTTELDSLQRNTRLLLDELVNDSRNYVVIYPNNDHGSNIILNEYKRLENNKKFRIIPSMRFECFLTLMKNADLVIGNSSAGIREAPMYGIPAVDLGTRQMNRALAPTIIHCDFNGDIKAAIKKAYSLGKSQPNALFGEGNSDTLFLDILHQEHIWKISKQKHFVDLK